MNLSDCIEDTSTNTPIGVTDDERRGEAIANVIGWLAPAHLPSADRWLVAARRAILLVRRSGVRDWTRPNLNDLAAIFGTSGDVMRRDLAELSSLWNAEVAAVAKWIREHVLLGLEQSRDVPARAARMVYLLLAAINDPTVGEASGEAIARRFGVSREQIRNDRDRLLGAIYGPGAHHRRLFGHSPMQSAGQVAEQVEDGADFEDAA